MSEGLEIYGDKVETGEVIDSTLGKETEERIREYFAIQALFGSLISGEVTRQISTLKEEVSDLIGNQFDGFKIEQVADAVKAAVADGKRVANMDSFKEVQKRYNVGLKYEDIHELISTMECTRKEIHTKRQILRTVRQSMDNASLAVKEAEANILADITSEVTDAGKPAYSNDKARQAELMVRKGEDDDYLAAAQQYISIRQQAEALEDEISSLDSDLKTAEMQFHAECKSLEAMTAEMNIYAAALGAGASACPGAAGMAGISEAGVSIGPAGINTGRVIVCETISAANIETPVSEQINAKINSEPKGW